MGLDMYLERQIHVAGLEGAIPLDYKGRAVKIDPYKVTTIIEEIGYWRKANQIHNWFVQNVQDGKDNCGKYRVSQEQLVELKNLCKRALESKDPSLLPPLEGFFFGSTRIDDFYFDDLNRTIEILDKIEPDGDYYYSSSW